MDLADQLIAKHQANVAREENGFAPHYGIDETGLPVPKPINADYVVMRIIGNVSIYRAGDDFFVGRRTLRQNSQALIALTGRPKLVIFDNESLDEDGKREENENMWKQMKNVINSESGLIWEMMRKMVPVYNKRYIRINDQLVWDRENTDIIVMPKGNEE